MAERGRGIAVGEIVEGIHRREPDADPACPQHLGGGIGHLEQQTRAVLHRPSIGILPPVRRIPQELVEQIAVGAMQLDPVEPRGLGVDRRAAEIGDDAGDLVELQGPGRDEGLKASRGHGAAGRLHRRGAHRQGAVRLQRGMGDSADMPGLEEDAPAPGMDRLGDQPPALDLLRRVDPGRAGIALALGRDLGALGDDQPRRGALGVVAGVEGMGRIFRIGTVARHGSHDDAILQGKSPDLNRLE